MGTKPPPPGGFSFFFFFFFFFFRDQYFDLNNFVKKKFSCCVCQKIRHLIYLWSDVVTTLILFFLFFLVNFDFICQLDITSINITLIKDLAFIQKFPSSDSLLIFFSFSGFYNICIIYTYIHIHIHIYIYTYTHIHIYQGSK